MWGPYVLAYDQQQNNLREAPPMLGIVPENETAPVSLATVAGGPLKFAAKVHSARHPEPRAAVLVPFADAGADGGRFQVWLYAPGAELPVNAALSACAQESRSRPGNVPGSITDGEVATFVVTFDRTRQEEDWYAVALDAPESVQRVVFAHGKTFHDGGWFDTGAGKPRIQVQREQNGTWETVAELSAYPATTSTDAAGLRDGQVFTQSLPQRVRNRLEDHRPAGVRRQLRTGIFLVRGTAGVREMTSAVAVYHPLSALQHRSGQKINNLADWHHENQQWQAGQARDDCQLDDHAQIERDHFHSPNVVKAGTQVRQ